MTLKVFETFSGIGAQTKALKNIGIKHKVVATSEWDINAIISYAYIHHKDEMLNFPDTDFNTIKENLSNKVFSNDGKKPILNLNKTNKTKLIELYKANKIINNLGSIKSIKSFQIPDFDLLTYSFPCQAISLQGKQEGLIKGTDTSSSLLWEIERILIELKNENRLPKYLLMENVANLFSKNFMPFFEEWLKFLNEMGYESKYQILKASNFDCPQNRERAFSVSVLKEKKELNNDFIQSIEEFNFIVGNLTNKSIKDILDTNNKNSNEINNILDSKLLLSELEIKLKHKNKNDVLIKKSRIHSTVLENYTTFESENIVYFDDGIAPTITANGAQSRIKIIDSNLNNKLRYLTPREHLKLMGFTDLDYKNLLDSPLLIKDHIIKKQAGNSICVSVLESIFLNMFKK